MRLISIRQNRESAAINRVLPTFLFLSLTLIIGWFLMTLKFIFLPLLLALFGTFLLSPPVEWLHRHRLPRPVGMIVTLATALALIWLGWRYLSVSFISFYDGFPKYEERAQDLLNQAKAVTNNFYFLTPERLKSALSDFSISNLAGNTLNSLITIIGYVLVTLIFLLHFLPAYPTIPDKIKKAFPDRRGPLLCRAFKGIGHQVQGYIWAKIFTSFFTGLGVALPCLLFGVDFALTWGVFAAVLNFIPTVGAFLSVLPPVAISLLQPELAGLSTSLWLTIFLTIIMILTGNFLEPLILGQSVNLSPTASLIAFFLWGWLWGPIGLLIAVPAMAMVKLTCDNIDSLQPVGIMLSSKAKL